MKEHLSKAYLHLLASAAGLDLGDWGNDYDGVDTTIKSHVDYYPFRLQPAIDVQLKCTGQDRATRSDTIAWSLETRTIKYYGAPNRSNFAIFCVLVVAGGPGLWLTRNMDGLLAHSHMYWIRGKDLPKPGPGEKQVVHFPKANLLDSAKLLDLMEEASKWQPSFG